LPLVVVSRAGHITLPFASGPSTFPARDVHASTDPTPHAAADAERSMLVKFSPNDRGNPPGKLADAELHFAEGPLDGLKLIGFAIWERRNGNGRNVTFPARQYSVNGERRSFALLRPVVDAASQERLREVILQAYAEHEEQVATAE